MKRYLPLFYGLILYVILFAFQACNTSPGEKQESRESIISANKPMVDTSRILDRLSLYRARRYDSVQSALSDDPEKVYKMVLWGKKLGVIPPAIGQLKYLHSLDVAHNELAELPEELSELHYLQGFYANGNRLKRFPEQILLLPMLDRVDLSENQIMEIPEGIARMDQLTKLDMGENRLTDLPAELFELTNLEILTLDHNALGRLSPGISGLRKLRKLDLSNNFLKEIPWEITGLKETLTDLEIQGNQIPAEQVRSLAEAMPSTNIRF
ncbi:MAG TPA: leucine-rich repeat domain-containing protein [Bacteroides sp.]|nr:leucine-rich repeat domain-containing protein [Bacteroides sp.]